VEGDGAAGAVIPDLIRDPDVRYAVIPDLIRDPDVRHAVIPDLMDPDVRYRRTPCSRESMQDALRATWIADQVRNDIVSPAAPSSPTSAWAWHA
jgi:hypothetical protein